MNDCRILTKQGRGCEVLVVGHSAGGVPDSIAAEATRLALGKAGDHSFCFEAGQAWLVLRIEEEPWLVGGEAWRIAGARLAELLREHDALDATLRLDGDQADVQALVEGILLGDYRYDAHRSGDAAARPTLTVRLPGQRIAVREGGQVAASQNLARSLADAPPNELHPAAYVRRLRKELKGTGLRIQVIAGLAKLEEAGFPGLVQVGKAGSSPPALVRISYVPEKPRRDAPHLGLVGKGITFDSGGLSIKPAENMWTMKGDMAGSAAVVGAMHLIAAQRPRVQVTAWLALAENLPDRKAMRPGDIYRTRKGIHVHIDNTDAEGRLVLADVLTHACEEGVSHLVDAATLTGACIVALGPGVAGVMGRHDDWVAEVRAAGQQRGEEFWPLPLYGEYRKLLDHPHADLNNSGGRQAGALTAGIFLSEFVDPAVRWAHCDIAGPAMRVDGWRAYAKGNTGFATRSFAQLAQRLDG